MNLESTPEFPPAGKPEHVGSGKPLETATEAVKRIAGAMVENEEKIIEARRGNKLDVLRKLKDEQLELLKKRQTILQKTTVNRTHKLKG